MMNITWKFHGQTIYYKTLTIYVIIHVYVRCDFIQMNGTLPNKGYSTYIIAFALDLTSADEVGFIHAGKISMKSDKNVRGFHAST